MAKRLTDQYLTDQIALHSNSLTACPYCGCTPTVRPFSKRKSLVQVICLNCTNQPTTYGLDVEQALTYFAQFGGKKIIKIN